MQYIRQINSVGTNTYTVLITTGYGEEGQPSLFEHPSIVEHPELFEITEDPIPEQHQYLILLFVQQCQ
jgi:hypothetical protein